LSPFLGFRSHTFLFSLYQLFLFFSLTLSTSLSSPSTGKQPFIDGNRLSLRPIAPYLAGKPRIRIDWFV
jgi:hypothetical protein